MEKEKIKSGFTEALKSYKEENHKADTFIFYLIMAHFPFALLASWGYDTFRIAFIGASAITVLTIASKLILKRGRAFSSLLGIYLISYSILLIQVQLGRIEMHFHIFGILAFLLIYRDWLIILIASLFIAIHHLVFNFLQMNDFKIGDVALLIFNYGCGWDIVFVHAFFVVFESSILIYYSITRKNSFIEQKLMFHQLLAEQNKKDKIIVEMTQTSNKLLETSDHLKEKSVNLANSTQDQAASIEEITASIEEMNASASGIEEKLDLQVKIMKELAEKMDILTGSNAVLMSQIHKTENIFKNAVEGIHTGEQSLKIMNSSMNKIYDNSEQMSEILSSIDDIAEKINLLSLNASIEAARAGDAGRGFSVVANEVYKLAEQTASSTKEINVLIHMSSNDIKMGMENAQSNFKIFKSIIQEINTVGQSIQEVSDSINKETSVFKMIVEDTKEGNEMSAEIDISIKEQKNAIDEIMNAVSNINNITQEVASVMEKAREESEKVRNMAVALNESVQKIS